ncbi:MAG: hypothetical protein NT155_03900 [Candidatus Staskawiczbacteria bacterium]|nr:hypothetical protein [Candidatus Staskawiczbacteria bacterium]
MKTIKIALVALSIAALPLMAFAVVSNPINNVSGGGISDLNTLVNSILAKMWVVFAGIAVIMFLVAGILFLTAGGQPEKIQSARSAFIWGVAGVVVGIIAYSIIAIVGSFVQ